MAAGGLRAKLAIPGSGQAQPFEVASEFFEHALEDGNRFQLAGRLVLRLLGIVLGKSLCAVRVGDLRHLLLEFGMMFAKKDLEAFTLFLVLEDDDGFEEPPAGKGIHQVNRGYYER